MTGVSHPPAAQGAIARLEDQIAGVLRGKPEAIRRVVVCLLARGNVLIEDVPGVGKTTLAQAVARSLGLAFQRIQFTSDLLPSDIIGVTIFRRETESFEFVPGPLFANVVLADEINRASPKTQSALLEAMSEGKVSIERKRYVLPRPFMVLATQNPLEYVGTFPLPESQLDRFLMSLRLGYPPREAERQLLNEGGVDETLAELRPVIERDDLLALQAAVPGIQVADKVVEYMIELVEATRRSEEILLGVSTRGLQDLHRACKALALAEDRSYVIPDDVQRLAVPVLAHRIVLRRGDVGLEGNSEAIARVVESVPVPV